MKPARGILSCLFSLAAISAQADTDDWDLASSHKTRCSIGTMLDMSQCLQGELDAVEKRLNDQYQALLQSLVNPGELRAAQRAWLAFRKQECDFATSGIGKEGSLYPYAMTACQIDLDEKRLKDLQRYLSADGAGAPARKSQ